MPKEFRQTICKNEYIDIDIENAAPTILSNYCKLKNIECPNLTEYAKNRTKVFDSIINKYKNLDHSVLKQMFIDIVNGHKLHDELSKGKFTTNFYYELRKIRDQISELNKPILEMVTKK